MDKSIDETHEWRRLEEFEEGDCIHAWSSDMFVIRVKIEKRIVRLFYLHDGEEKVLVDKVGEEYIARKRGLP